MWLQAKEHRGWPGSQEKQGKKEGSSPTGLKGMGVEGGGLALLTPPSPILASRTAREQISAVLCHLVCGIFFLVALGNSYSRQSVMSHIQYGNVL